jgi:hypothetical protein
MVLVMMSLLLLFDKACIDAVWVEFKEFVMITLLSKLAVLHD